MPDRIQVGQLAILLLALPLQYTITQIFWASESDRAYSLHKLSENTWNVWEWYLSPRHWVAWTFKQLAVQLRLLKFKGSDGARPISAEMRAKLKKYQSSTMSKHDKESPAIEVLEYREAQQQEIPESQWFAQSLTPRDPKPPHVQFRVGQVVRHKRWGYRGVIVGWDETARAPKDWLDKMHHERPEWRRQPNYSILVDTRDRQTPQVTYVPQENIELVKNVRVVHPDVEQCFERYDGAQYLPRPWLRTLYPYD